MTEIRLGSSEFAYAPNIFAWAQNGYVFKSDRKRLRNVLRAWPNVAALPDKTIDAILKGKHQHHIDGETVVITIN